MIDEGFLSETEINQLNALLQELENKTLDYVAVSYGKIKTQSTDCTLFCARAFRLDQDDGGGVCIQLVGNRFLRRMVRILVSTALLQVFEGETSLLGILEPKDRSLSARPAPSGGLMFVGADFQTM
jgi:tRNA U38,U39,U40 pseudouridine synthase TruA